MRVRAAARKRAAHARASHGSGGARAMRRALASRAAKPSSRSISRIDGSPGLRGSSNGSSRPRTTMRSPGDDVLAQRRAHRADAVDREYGARCVRRRRRARRRSRSPCSAPSRARSIEYGGCPRTLKRTTPATNAIAAAGDRAQRAATGAAGATEDASTHDGRAATNVKPCCSARIASRAAAAGTSSGARRTLHHSRS